MKWREFISLIGCITIGWIASGDPSSASPVGLWQAKDGGKMRIAPCGQNLCGFVTHTNPPNAKDTNNVDPAKRSRSLVGVQVLISMKPNGASKWSGQLYDDNTGRTYEGNLMELGPSSIKIEGCLAMICDGETLTRVK